MTYSNVPRPGTHSEWQQQQWGPAPHNDPYGPSAPTPDYGRHGAVPQQQGWHQQPLSPEEQWQRDQAARRAQQDAEAEAWRQQQWKARAAQEKHRHDVALRQRLADTMRIVNVQHMETGINKVREGQEPLAPHGVTLLYQLEDPTHASGYRIYAACRFAYSDAEHDDLNTFLSGLTDVCQRFSRSGTREQPWDPRGPERSLVNFGDLDMPRHARYVGFGVDTLDVGDRKWVPIARDMGRHDYFVTSQMIYTVAGEAVIVMTDGIIGRPAPEQDGAEEASIIRVVRDSNKPPGYQSVTSNKSLDPNNMDQRTARTRPIAEDLGGTLRTAWPHIANLASFFQHHLAGPRGH